MVENGSKIPGVERAAILLLSLGEAPAAEVLKHMAPKEVQKIGAAMAALTNVSRDQVGAVLENFTKALDNHHGGVVLVNGFLYGANHEGSWVCLDFKTGQVKYRAEGVGKGSILFAYDVNGK